MAKSLAQTPNFPKSDYDIIDDGSLDTSLKGSRVVTNALNIYPEALVLQPDGKIVVAGYTVEATSNAIAVLRYLGDPVILTYLPVILKE